MIDVSKKLGNDSIGELQKNKDIGALITIVEKTNNPSDGRFAIWALGDLKAEMAIEPLIHALLSNSYRQEAVKALGNIGNEEAVKPLFHLIRNHDEVNYIREEILESLGKIASKEAINIIIEMLLHEEISAKALDVLKKLGELAVEPLIIALNTDMKDTAIVALGEIGECAKAATLQLLALLETVTDKNAPNCNILIALALIKDPSAVEPLIKKIKYSISPGDDGYSLQNQIILTLGDIGSKLATKALIRLILHNRNERLRESSAAALGKIGDNMAIEPLLTILENRGESPSVRDAVAWALLQLDETQTALPVVRYLKQNYHSNFNFLIAGIPFPAEFHNTAAEP